MTREIQATDEVKRGNDAARAILREMFPRQYGLPGAFGGQGNGSKNEVGHCPV